VATRESVLAVLGPVLDQVAMLDARDPGAAAAALAGLDLEAVRRALLEAHGEGWLTAKEAGGVRFGRLTRPSPESHELSVDVVDMAGAASGAHTHVTGEFDLCFPLEGAPRFDGRPGPWVVYPPGSRHVPTVTGGRMLIVYFVPGGQLRFEG